MKMKKIISMLIIAVLMFTMLSACGGDKADSAAIKLGLTGPLTGPYAIYGQAAARGAQIAVDEINALEKGAFKFEFQAEDDEGDPEIAVNAYNKLMDDGMDILVGTVTSGACIAVAAETYAWRGADPSPPSAPETAYGPDGPRPEIRQGVLCLHNCRRRSRGTPRSCRHSDK